LAFIVSPCAIESKKHAFITAENIGEIYALVEAILYSAWESKA